MKYLWTVIFLFCSGLCAVAAGDEETYRPRFHFSPVRGWMSDPNGLVYYDGEYHLCYQHIPFDANGNIPWGKMYWGHAVSRDLLHWDHLPIALSPDSLGYIFSGCCVADLNNTSGLGTPDCPPLVALFTYYDPVAAGQGRITETQSQGLAYSIDRGRTWIKYVHNPVLRSPGLPDFRDPHLFWHAPTGEWVMVLTGGASVRLYGSKNCIDWHYLSEFGAGRGSHTGPWECPDLFPVQVAGSKETRWVLLASVVNFTDTPQRLETATQYFIGTFDGRTFTSDQQDTLWVDYGRDNYAGITFDNAPLGRRIFIGWMHSHQYAAAAQGHTTRSWSGAATFPRELKIVHTVQGYRLVSHPVREIGQLYGKRFRFKNITSQGITRLGVQDSTILSPCDMTFTLEIPDPAHMPSRYGIKLSNAQGEYIIMGYDRCAGCYFVERPENHIPRFHDQFAGVQRAFFPVGCSVECWRLLVDVASLELFVAGGQIVFTDVFFTKKPFTRLELFSEEGVIRLKKAVLTPLKPCVTQPFR